MKPFVKYPGGKSKEIKVVNKYKPSQIERYFEPFIGGGAIFFDLIIEKNFINDYSKDLIQLYSLIKKRSTKLKKYLIEFDRIWQEIETLTDFSKLEKYAWLDVNKLNSYFIASKKRKEKLIEKINKTKAIVNDENKEKLFLTAKKTAFYMIVRDIYNHLRDNNEMHIASYFFLREYCYSSMFRFSKTGEFNVPYGGLSYNKKYLTTKIKYMYSIEMKEKLLKAQIYNMDFARFLNKFEFNENDFIFLDPPYDSDFSTYDKNVFDKTEQIRLRDTISNVKAKWMLIIKKTDFISEIYENFYIYEYDKNYMVSFKNRNDKEVKHLLITNYNIQGE